MGILRNLKKRDRKVSAPTKSPSMPLRSKRPSVVDGKVLEPEWDQVPQTYGSFNQDTLARISQTQAEHAYTERPMPDLPQTPSSSPDHPPRSSSLNWGASMNPASPHQPKNRRYYSSALSDEDKTALVIGELNHNLREWTGDRLIQYHVSRLELVPCTEERQEIIADILDEKRGSERLVLKSAHQAKRFAGEEPSHPMGSLRAASTPSLLLSQISPSSPVSPPTSTSRQGFPFPVVDAQKTGQSSPRSDGSSNGDHLSRQSVGNSTAQYPHASESSRDSSRSRGRTPDRLPLVRRADRNTSRVRSPLASEATPYIVKPDVTFDKFLTAHASGKGETHRDSIHIKKEGQPRNFSRRLSKMPSMPQLRKRVSQTFNVG